MFHCGRVDIKRNRERTGRNRLTTKDTRIAAQIPNQCGLFLKRPFTHKLPLMLERAICMWVGKNLQNPGASCTRAAHMGSPERAGAETNPMRRLMKLLERLRLPMPALA